jgi:hypothetical protein
MNTYNFSVESEVVANIKSFDDLFSKFNVISNIPHNFECKNDKDAGDYFEQLLGKSVDNLNLPDLELIDTEIKTSSGKKKTTAFTKSFDGGLTIRELVEKYGYVNDDNKLNNKGYPVKRLMISVTKYSNNRGFYLEIHDDKLYVMNKDEKLSYWYLSTLIKSIAGKMPNLAYVKYSKTKDTIIFNDMILYKNISSNKIIKLLEDNEMIVDIRARHGYQHKRESYIRDRGTAFRLTSSDVYEKIFEEKIQKS